LNTYQSPIHVYRIVTKFCAIPFSQLLADYLLPIVKMTPVIYTLLNAYTHWHHIIS